jgi:hypothetical protein
MSLTGSVMIEKILVQMYYKLYGIDNRFFR